MTHSPWFAIPAGVLLLTFIVFAFRQGLKVSSDPEGIPPESTGGGGPSV
jgi:hypothetical protein